MALQDTGRERQARFLRNGFLFLFFILILRFFQMQVVSGSVYKERSDQNSVRQIPILASRGLILDRKGQVLVENRPSYSLFLVPFDFRKNRTDAVTISSLLGLSVEEMETRIEETGGGPFTPVRIIRDMDFETLSKVEENRFDLPGVFYQVELVRTYPSGIRATHVLGYPGEISGSELESLKDRGFSRGDIVGKSGLEKRYDAALRGERGYKYVEVDVQGREVGNFNGQRDILPVPGKNLTTTLDAELQGQVEMLMDTWRGAAIVMDPRNGEILAMVSTPDYNLEPFAKGLTQNTWEQLTNDPDKPLLNRAIQAQLPPGSTYKLILTIAALEENVITPEEEIYCGGHFWLGDRMFDCWQPGGHGNVDLLNALKESCNVFFYNLGLKTGIDRWARYGRELGFGSATEIDLPDEKQGILPNRRYLDIKYSKQGWGKGMVVNLSVGQGDLLVTPIQMVRLASAIAMEGHVATLHVVRSVQEPLSGAWGENAVRHHSLEAISPKTYGVLKEGMHRVVNASGGTGRAAQVSQIAVCGKTGTAQNPQGEPHSWFLGFAPYKDPMVALVVVVENGGSGGGLAASIAGHILRWMFRQGVVS